MRRTTTTFALVILLGASCGGGGGEVSVDTTSAGSTTSHGPTTTTTNGAADPTTTTSGGSSSSPIITETIRAYFDAFALNDEGREAMLANSLEGSSAYAYAAFWWYLWLAAGTEASFEQVIDVEPGEIAACIPPGQETSLDEGCLTYTDFVTDAGTGLLVDFDAEGIPISEKAALGDGSADSADGISIRVVAAALTGSNRITVVWETSNANEAFSEGEVRMISPSGDIVQTDAWTQNDVPANGLTFNAAHFSVPGFGGTLQYRIVATGTILEVPLPTL